MLQIKTYSNFNEFLQFNDKLLENNYFQFYHINCAIDKIKKRNCTILDAYNIIDSESSIGFAVWTDEAYFIYSTNWDEEILEILIDKINFEKYDLQCFRGNKNLIVELFKKTDYVYKIINDRIIYEQDQIIDYENKTNEIVSIVKPDDFDVVSEMYRNYYKEDFNGTGKKNEEELLDDVNYHVFNSSLFALKVNNQIVSIAAIINNNPKQVMIGSLYTNWENRNKGYGTTLVASLNNRLLREGAIKCGLLTEATNIGSNRVFEKLGFKRVSEWINLILISKIDQF